MNIPGFTELAQLEQLRLLLAAASQIPGLALPPTIPAVSSYTPTSDATAANTSQGVAFSSSQLDPKEIHDADSPGHVVPDGKSAKRYPEPDVKTFVFDPALGYRFDPSTGLHYDANSGLFINKRLEILLKYDNLSSTYEHAGSTADITAPVLRKEFAELMGCESVKPPSPPPACPFPSAVSPECFTGISLRQIQDQWRRSPSNDEKSPSPRSYSRHRSPSCSPQRNHRQTPSPARGIDSRRDHSLSPRPGRSRKSRTYSPPSKIRTQRSRSRSKDHVNKGDDTLLERSITRIHERNLKNPDNVLARFLPPNFTLTSLHLEQIMVSPLPPKGDREWEDLEILFKGILKSNDVPFGNVKVFTQNGNTPYDLLMIRFKSLQDATRWYLLHKGALDLANPDGSKCSAYMHFTQYYWRCESCQYFNFPMRVFCYGCLKPQKVTKEMGVVPIESKVEGSKWVGLKKMDYRLTSTQEVLDSLPPLDAGKFALKSCELMTEKNGLPLGFCLFETANKNSAKDLHKFFKKISFTPVYLQINSRIGLSNNPLILTQKPESFHQMTQTAVVNKKGISDYILSSWPVDTQVRNQKGTQTILAYKHL